jgi:hypothetical protein
MEETLSHYSPIVSKKLKAKNLNRESLLEIFRKEDITLEENYNFIKPVLPQNLKLLNNVLFDFLMKDTKGKKVILVKDIHEKLNRNSLEKLSDLAEKNKKVEFFYMPSTEENLKLLKEKYGLEFLNYPQLLILEDNKIRVIPQYDYLSISENKDLGKIIFEETKLI